MSIGITNLDDALQVNVGTFLGRDRIFIRESSMEIQTWFLCFPIGRRKFAHDRVQALRYEEWTEGGIRTCGIRFKYEGETHVLIRGPRESPALRAILNIIRVYKFSHSVPLQDQG
jgi:hypothetical protein